MPGGRPGADARVPAPSPHEARLLADRLVLEVAGAWARGWRPDEVHRLLARDLSPGALAVVGDAMAEEVSRHASATVAPDWFARLREVDAAVWWARDTTFVAARARLDGGLAAVVPDVDAGICALRLLPGIPVLAPLPGAWHQTSQDRPHVEERILERVRALLAKAESTTFEAEAETFTAGAQALMARHSIDAAMLAAAQRGRPGDGPVAVRVGIDRPYEGPKVTLLDAVGRANRARTVWSKQLAFVTVVGFESDLAAVQTLFTSLLVQATRALADAGSGTAGGGLSRTRAFRSSFLTAFAIRIGERLQVVTDQETRAASARVTPLAPRGEAVRGTTPPGQDVVLVLAERAAEVDARVEELFPRTVRRSSSRSLHPEGWYAGRSAADAADLHGQARLAPG